MIKELIKLTKNSGKLKVENGKLAENVPFPLQGSGLGRGGNLKPSKQWVSPSLKFVSSPQLANKFFSLPRREKRIAFTLAEVIKKFPPFLGMVRVGMKQYPSQPPLIRGGALAFTLAEVLITLGVIGGVAAMTLPSLIKNYNNYVTAQKLKKAYNTLSNGIRMAEVDHGPMKDWPKRGDIEVYSYFDTYFKPYFKGIKLCKNMIECGYKDFDSKKWQPSNKSWGIGTNNSRLLFQLIDGIVVFYPISSGTSYIDYVDYIYVDINGVQKPNTYEKDVYNFKRGTDKGIEPTGKALEIMQNGWKMDY